MQKIIFYYWKNSKIPQVPSSAPPPFSISMVGSAKLPTIAGHEIRDDRISLFGTLFSPRGRGIGSWLVDAKVPTRCKKTLEMIKVKKTWCVGIDTCGKKRIADCNLQNFSGIQRWKSALFFTVHTQGWERGWGEGGGRALWFFFRCRKLMQSSNLISAPPPPPPPPPSVSVGGWEGCHKANWLCRQKGQEKKRNICPQKVRQNYKLLLSVSYIHGRFHLLLIDLSNCPRYCFNLLQI